MTTVPLDEITIPSRRRGQRPVDQLAASISEIGLLNPITVTGEGGSYRLIAGLHRLEACRRLGWDDIPATVVTLSDVDAELAEIDENLVRNDLTALEHAEYTSRRKALYEAKHPSTKKGGDHGNQHTVGRPRLKEMISFSQDTSEKTGVTPRSVRHDVQIADRLTEDVRDMLRETPLADIKTVLLDLARVEDPDIQASVARRVIEGGAQTVRSAVRQLQEERGEDLLNKAGVDEDRRHEVAKIRKRFLHAIAESRNGVFAFDTQLVGPLIQADELASIRDFISSGRSWFDRLERDVFRAGLHAVGEE